VSNFTRTLDSVLQSISTTQHRIGHVIADLGKLPEMRTELGPQVFR
jgi:hypothetical protein